MISAPAPSRLGGLVLPGNRHDLLADQQPESPPEVTVVIPYFDAQPQLDLVLTGLSLQTHPASRLQVVVVDDGSPTAPVVPPGVTVLWQPDLGVRPATARNLGASVADGSVLVFLDGDTVPERDYVERACRLPALCVDALVVGRRRYAELGSCSPDDVRAWLAGDVPGPAELPPPAWLEQGYVASRGLLDVDDRSYRYVISAVLTMATGLFAEIGGFADDIRTYGGEDWELTHRAFTAGAVLAYEPDAVAWHDGPDWSARDHDPATALRQKNDETLALAQLLPDPLLRGPGSWPPYSEVVVEVNAAVPDEAGTTTPTAWLVCLRTLLATGLDLQVWLRCAVAGLDGDHRVHVGTPPRAVTDRARVRVRLSRPVAFAPGVLARLLREVAAPGPGRLATTDGGVSVTASRAERRSARHGVALDQLVDVAVIDDADVPTASSDLSHGLAVLGRS